MEHHSSTDSITRSKSKALSVSYTREKGGLRLDENKGMHIPIKVGDQRSEGLICHHMSQTAKAKDVQLTFVQQLQVREAEAGKLVLMDWHSAGRWASEVRSGSSHFPQGLASRLNLVARIHHGQNCVHFWLSK